MFISVQFKNETTPLWSLKLTECGSDSLNFDCEQNIWWYLVNSIGIVSGNKIIQEINGFCSFKKVFHQFNVLLRVELIKKQF